MTASTFLCPSALASANSCSSSDCSALIVSSVAWYSFCSLPDDALTDATDACRDLISSSLSFERAWASRTRPSSSEMRSVARWRSAETPAFCQERKNKGQKVTANDNKTRRETRKCAALFDPSSIAQHLPPVAARPSAPPSPSRDVSRPLAAPWHAPACSQLSAARVALA